MSGKTEGKRYYENIMLQIRMNIDVVSPCVQINIWNVYIDMLNHSMRFRLRLRRPCARH